VVEMRENLLSSEGGRTNAIMKRKYECRKY
jgi:hypothetical protein